METNSLIRLKQRANTGQLKIMLRIRKLARHLGHQQPIIHRNSVYYLFSVGCPRPRLVAVMSKRLRWCRQP
jgi:hypothetical protein